MHIICLVLLMISTIYLILSFVKNSFIDLKSIFIVYYSIFKNIKNSIPFLIIPFILGLAFSLIYNLEIDLLYQFIVFIGIIIASLFSCSSIIISKSIKNKDEKIICRFKKVVKQTQSIIVVEIFFSILCLMFIIVKIAIYKLIKIYLWINKGFDFLILSLILMIILNLFIVIKRLFKIIEINE